MKNKKQDVDQASTSNTVPASEGVSCTGSAAELRAAAQAAGKGDLLEGFERDYPSGPHDQPQSMCPAFGSLRVGLRMRRTASVLSGSACCVYGLTFTSHFYGARRTVGYVPFNSETLVTGKLYEDIRDAVHELADPDLYDVVVVTNLCVPTASGIPLQMLPKEINGVRIVGIDVPGFGVPTHAEAKDVLAGAMLKYARTEAELGPVMAPKGGVSSQPSLALIGEIFPADPVSIGQMLKPMGLSVGPVVPTREWRELYSALNSEVAAAIHPFYTRAVREFKEAGRAVIGSAPVGMEGTKNWLVGVADKFNISSKVLTETTNSILPVIASGLEENRIKGRITLSGYEGSELLVARLLIESGADVRYVGSACPETEWSKNDKEWLEAHGAQVNFRASLEDDLAAVDEYKPDVAVGTTPVVQKAKESATPALYFTNLVSARPLMGAAGVGVIGQLFNAAIANKSRFKAMEAFFEGVGTEDNAGVWEDIPADLSAFRKKNAARRKASEKPIDKKANVEGAIGC